MSTRISVYYWYKESGPTIHLYKEMHDGLHHLVLSDNSNSEINVVIPDRLVPVLMKRLLPVRDVDE